MVHGNPQRLYQMQIVGGRYAKFGRVGHEPR
jgi:hypothetical protein